MGKSLVRLYDTVTITPSSVDSFASVKDNFFTAGSGKSLRADIVATHAGRLTRNHGFYLPVKMREGVPSLLENYGKPMLVHHNQHADPVGRIVDAKYIDTATSLVRNSAIDSAIKDLCNPNTPFYRSLTLIDQLAESDIIRDPNYPGLGHIIITAEITDDDAIKKVLDKRYLTVSIGASTDRAVCSVCKQDWVEEGPCEHRPGKVYDEKLAFIIAGKLIYDEVSFVNVPADSLARVITIQNGTARDSVVVEEPKQICNVNASFRFVDATKTGGQETMVDKVEKTAEQLAQEQADAAAKAQADAEKAAQDAAAAQAAEEARVKAEAEAKKLEEEAKKAAEKEPSESDKHYDAMIEFAWQLSLIDEAFEDKILTAADRDKMKKSTFCKPGERKYPVNDCDHAKVAMAYAKKNNESSSVLSCIRRKASALGCPFKGAQDGFEAWEKEVLDVILADHIKLDSKVDAQATQGVVTLPPDKKQDTQATNDCMACKEEKGIIDALRKELADINAEFDEMQKSGVDQLNKTKLALADTLVKLDMIAGKTFDDMAKVVNEVASMSLEDLFKKVDGLKDSLKLDVIVKKVNDGMGNVPAGTVQDPTVSDQATVDPTKSDETDPIKKYKETYNKMRDELGLEEADAYAKKLLRAGLVTADSILTLKGGNA